MSDGRGTYLLTYLLTYLKDHVADDEDIDERWRQEEVEGGPGVVESQLVPRLQLDDRVGRSLRDLG